MYTIPCVIFAGGKSSRMGRDKALLPFDGHNTLTEYQLHKFQRDFENIYISCKSQEKFDFQASFIEDNPIYHDSAPLVALASVFEQLSCEAIFAISVDTPFFQTTHFEKLFSHYHDSPIILSQSPKGKHPLCAIYKRETLPIMIDLIQEKAYRFSGLFDKIATTIVDFEEEDIFTNLNFPKDYQKAQQRNQNG